MDKHTKKTPSLFRYPVLVAFGLFFIGLFVLDMATPDRAYSELENTTLTQRPRLTAVSADGLNNYFTSYTRYVKDQVFGRDQWISLQSAAETTLFQKTQSGGILLGREHMMFARHYSILKNEEKGMAKNLAAVQSLAQRYPGRVNLMLVPSASVVYPENIPAGAPQIDEKGILEGVAAQGEAYGRFIDVLPTLTEHKEEYLYYRTDHHWTTRGAFLGYTAAAKKMGIYPLSEDFYDVEHASDKFRGTFYSKVLYNGIKPDTIDIWHLSENETQPEVEIYSTFGEEPTIHDGMYFREYLDVKDKYSTFFGTNQPMITIRTGHEGGKLLMFKDSYAHCFAPFMTEHYSEITMVDLRYIQISYKELIDVSDYDQVLFLYNASTFMSDENIKKLSY